jgi:hypothetical protein
MEPERIANFINWSKNQNVNCNASIELRDSSDHGTTILCNISFSSLGIGMTARQPIAPGRVIEIPENLLITTKLALVESEHRLLICHLVNGTTYECTTNC